jgi:hypothetical protein
MSCHNSANQNSIAIRDLQLTSSSAPAVVNSAPAGLMVIVDGLLQNTSSVLTDAVPLILGLSSVVDTNGDLLAGKRHLFRQHVPEEVLGKLLARDPGFAANVAWRARRRRRTYGADPSGATDSTAPVASPSQTGSNQSVTLLIAG